MIKTKPWSKDYEKGWKRIKWKKFDKCNCKCNCKICKCKNIKNQ